MLGLMLYAGHAALCLGMLACPMLGMLPYARHAGHAALCTGDWSFLTYQGGGVLLGMLPYVEHAGTLLGVLF